MNRYSPLELAQAFIKTGEIQDAREALNAHLEAHPDDQQALRMRAEVLLRFTDETAWHLALADFEALLNLTAMDILRYSVLLDKLARPEQAKKLLKQGIEQFPDDLRLLERYIQFLQQHAEYAEALDVLARQAPNWHWSQWQADIWREQGDCDRAIVAYGAALSGLQAHIDNMDKHWSASLQAWLLLARAQCYLQKGDDSHAENDLDTANALVTDEPMLAFYRGLIAYRRDHLSEALEHLQQAFKGASVQLQAQMWQELSPYDTLYLQAKQTIEE